MSIRFFAIFILSAIGLATSWAQDVPPPPKPSDTSPSLEVTMKFIEDKITDESKQSYTAFVSDSSGNEWNNEFKVELTNFVADARSCRMSFHWRAEVNGKVSDDSDYNLILKDARDVVVMPQEQNQHQIDVRTGHPTWNSRIEPKVFTLIVRRPKGLENVFLFPEEEIAGRVAKAVAHAIELCGGGEPF